MKRALKMQLQLQPMSKLFSSSRRLRIVILRVVKVTHKSQSCCQMSTFLSTIEIPHWQGFFDAEQKKDYWRILMDQLSQESKDYTIFPPKDKIFSAFEYTRPEHCKCIILGQDPYHGPNQANGLAFSVEQNQKLPPSLRNIFKEYQDDLQLEAPANGDLNAWAREGVFLLNTALTVRNGEAGSHKEWGWETFVHNALNFLIQTNPCIGFICFGNPAHRLVKNLLQEHTAFSGNIIHTPHPSPLSAYRGFFGSKPFTTFNNKQAEKGLESVNWELPYSAQKTLF